MATPIAPTPVLKGKEALTHLFHFRAKKRKYGLI